MKNTLKTILYLSIAICCLSSCKDEMDVDTGANVKTETFKDFWWKKHDPVTVNAVINTQFDECEQLDGHWCCGYVMRTAMPLLRKLPNSMFMESCLLTILW